MARDTHESIFLPSALGGWRVLVHARRECAVSAKNADCHTCTQKQTDAPLRPKGWDSPMLETKVSFNCLVRAFASVQLYSFSGSRDGADISTPQFLDEEVYGLGS